MKTGLFYTSAAFKYRYGIHYTDQLGQVYRKMPVTCGALVVLSLSMIGLPPFAGFFSKWYLALGAIQNGQYFYVAVLILSSLLSAIYFFRILEKLFMNPETAHEVPVVPTEEMAEGTRPLPSGKFELPWQMMIPLAAVVLAVIGLGLCNSAIVNEVLRQTVEEVFLQ